MPALALRPYQLATVDAIEEAERRGIHRPLIALPTGTGKTVVFAELIRRRGGRALVLAHRDELIEQAAAKIRAVYPRARIGIVKAARDEHIAPIVVASVQTLAQPRRLARVRPDFRTVIVDEAHHATAPTYRRILEAFGCMEDDGPLTVGVTATPERADGAPLGDVWHPEIVYRREILDMIRAGYLCDLRAIRIQIAADLDGVHVRGGDLVAGELDRALRDANAPAHAVAAYLEHAPGRKALVFTPSVALAHDIAAAFRAAGVSAGALDGTTATDERRAILARLHTGETMVVANCAVLTEGFDEPSIDCIVMARPTKSRPLYIQMLGRGTRTWPGKTDCIVLDLVANTRHRLVTAAQLATEWPEALQVEDGESVIEALERHERVRVAAQSQGRLVAEAVELFGRRDMAWIAVDPARYTMSVGDGLVVMSTADHATWTVEHVTRSRDRTVIAAGIELGYAQGAAEDYVRRLGATPLVDRAARWRQRPASERQLEALRRWRIVPQPGVTAGEASDLIATAAARCA